MFPFKVDHLLANLGYIALDQSVQLESSTWVTHLAVVGAPYFERLVRARRRQPLAVRGELYRRYRLLVTCVLSIMMVEFTQWGGNF